jgi:hypothetical protein
MTWESFWSKKNGEKIDDLGQVEQPPIADLSQVIRTEYNTWENFSTHCHSQCLQASVTLRTTPTTSTAMMKNHVMIQFCMLTICPIS